MSERKKYEEEWCCQCGQRRRIAEQPLPVPPCQKCGHEICGECGISWVAFNAESSTDTESKS